MYHDHLMDSQYSNLERIEKSYYMKVISLIWCVSLAIGLGSLLILDSYLVLVSLIVLDSIITISHLRYQNIIYYKSSYVTHRDLVRDGADGCAKYDDLWGGE